MESVKRRLETTQQALSLSKSGFEWDQRREEREKDRFLRTQRVVVRRVAAEEARFEPDAEERTAIREVRKETLEYMKAMMENLK